MATSGLGRDLPVLAEDCSGRTFIVTGGNTGLGYEAVKRLLIQGATRVILGVRNLSAGEKAKAEIEAATNKTGVAEVWHVDLASYDSVKAFAKKATAELDRIDAVIENAGVFPTERIMAEGHQLTVTVNILSTFLLAVLLLPKLSETARTFDTVPHVAVVGSSMGFYYQEAWDSVKDAPLTKMDAEQEDVMRNYPLSKLVNVVFIRHFAPLVPVAKTGVVVNVLCPGLCRTELGRSATPDFKNILENRYAEIGRTAEEGSRCLLHAAFAGKESHGRYLDSCKIDEENLPTWVTDDEGKKSSQRLWEVVTKELERIEPRCVGSLLAA